MPRDITSISTRGIWNERSMIFYLSNLFTNPFMLSIVLNGYIPSMLGYTFHKDDVMQSDIFMRIHVLFVYWKR